MFLRFDHRHRLRVNEMPDTRVATNQHKLLERSRGPALLQQPKHALDRNIHNIVRRLLAGRQMHHMRHPVYRAGDISELRDRPLHHLQSLAPPQHPIVAQSPNVGIRPRGVGHKSADKVLPDFARRAGDQNGLALFTAHPIPFNFNARLPSIIFSNCSRITPRS